MYELHLHLPVVVSDDTHLPLRAWALLRVLLLLSRFSRVRLRATPQTAAHQAPRPWDSPGKNTGVGFPFLPNA